MAEVFLSQLVIITEKNARASFEPFSRVHHQLGFANTTSLKSKLHELARSKEKRPPRCKRTFNLVKKQSVL